MPQGLTLDDVELEKPKALDASDVEFEQPKTLSANELLAKQGLGPASAPTYKPVQPQEAPRLGVDVDPAQAKNVSDALGESYSGLAEAPGTALGVKGYPKMAHAVKQYVRANVNNDDLSLEERNKLTTQSGSEFVQGAGEAATPLLGAGLIAAPVRTAIGLGTGLATSYGAGKVAEEVGASPETQEFAKDVGFFAPSVLGAASGLHTADIPPNEAGVTGKTAEMFGGRVKGAAVSGPRGKGVGVKVGNTSFAVGAEPSATEVSQAQTLSEGVQAMVQAQEVDAQAARVANGQPPVPPPPKPPIVNDQQVKARAEQIKNLPPEAQPEAIAQSHQELSKLLSDQGVHVNRDGTVEPVTSPKAAAKVAADIINKEAENEKPSSSSQPVAAEAQGAQAQPEPKESSHSTAQGESELEQARRGAGEPQAEELPVNQVPVEQRPSTTIPLEENARMAARLDSRNLEQGDTVQLPSGDTGKVAYIPASGKRIPVTLENGKTKWTMRDRVTPVSELKPEEVEHESTAAKGPEATAELARKNGIEATPAENQHDIQAQADTMRMHLEEIAEHDPELAKQIEAEHPEVKELLAKARELASNKEPHDQRGNESAVPETSARTESQVREVSPSSGNGRGVPEPGQVGELETRLIHQAPHRFQYKLNTDSEGVGTLLKEQSYKPELAGVVSVWRDPADGRFYVTNGHHRVELAKRSGQPRVNVLHIEAKNEEEARASGALQNIAEGRGTPVDAAKFIRDSHLDLDKLKAKGISMAESTASKGVALSKLDDSIFSKVVQGDFPIERAVAIGEATDNHAEQKAIADLIDRQERKGKKVSNDTLRELVRFVKGSGQSEETTASLFGAETVQKSHALEKAEVSAYIKQQLAKDKKLFGFVSKGERAEELERGNNIIDVKTSKALAEEAIQGEEVYNKLSERAGPISDILDDAAARLAGGENANAVKQEAYSDIKSELAQTLGGSSGARAQEREGAARREFSLGGQEETAGYRQRQANSELSDSQLSSWSKSRSLRISDGGKQNSLFGGDEPMYKLTRLGSDGNPEHTLVSQTQFDSLRKEFQNFDKAARAFEQGVEPAGVQTSMFETKAEKPEKDAGYGSGNLFVTADDAEQARDILRSKSTQLNSGLDPEAFTAMVKLGAYHFEAGAREFGKWSAEMVKQAGEAIKPHLQAIYDDILDRFRPAAIWKLKSADIIAQKMKGAMPGNDLARMLRNNGIKPDEMKWTGLDDFLKDKARVSPAEAREFLRQNDVQVKEVLKGNMNALGLSRDKWANQEFGKSYSDLSNSQQEYVDALFDEPKTAQTKFASYQLPGGDNYRELLLTLPENKDSGGPPYEWKQGRTGWAYFDSHGKQVSGAFPDETYKERAWSTISSPKLRDATNFRSGHFDEPNVLAHVRFNDRIDAQGKKTLFLEELQSDWHQKGRRVGYRDEDQTAAKQRLAALEAERKGIWEKLYPMLKAEDFGGWDHAADAAWDAGRPEGEQGNDYPQEARALARQWRSLRQESVNIEDGLSMADRVPDAPFKKDWHELALKRMLRYAAENNYEKLAWTTGEQQAERYDLSKQVASIEVSPRTDMATGEKTRSVHIDLNGNTIPSYINLGVDKNGIVDNATQAGLKGKPLSEVVGKDVADKIMQSDRQTIEGEGLKVGGSGMKGFYDKIIPDFLNKYGKKWGVQVGESSLDKTPRYYAEQLDDFNKRTKAGYQSPSDTAKWAVIRDDGQSYDIPAYATTKAVAENIAQEYAENAKRNIRTAHSIDITPAMRDSVMQGQYLYAGLPLDEMVRQAVVGIHKATQTEAAQDLKDWLGNEAQKIAQSRDIQKGLYDLEGAYAADVLRAVKFFKSIPGTPIDQTVIYHNLEDPDIKLSAGQEQLKGLLTPLVSENERIYRKLSNGGVPVENYVHRVVEGKGNFIDRLLSGSKGGPGNILSKRAGATKSRSMMSLEDGDGNRKLVSVKDGNVNIIQRGVNGESISRPAGKVETKDGERVVSLNGKLWNLTQATTKEIEAGTDLRYYKNAAASTITSYLELRKAERAYDFLESLKSDPKFQDFAWTKGKDGTNAPPKGWKPTKLAQFQGYYFEPHQAEVFDWYWDRIHHDVNAWDKLGRVMMTSIFYNPLLHVPNVGAQWLTEGGTQRFVPSNVKNAWKSGDRATKAVRDLNDDYIEALRAGAPLMAYRPEADQLQKMFFDHLGDEMQKDSKFAAQMKEMFGSNLNPYALSHKITWGSNDVLLLQSIYEHMGKGDSMKDAIKKATEIIPDYRLPTRIFDSAATAKILSNRGVTMFMPYHYGVLKSAAKIAAGAAKGDKDAYGRLIALALLTYVLYPAIDKGVKKLSGNPNARMKRSGLAGIVDNIQQVIQGHKSPTQALQSVITPAVHTKTAIELGFNRDLYTGNQVYDPHAPAGKIAKQIGRKLAGTIGPADQALRAYDNKHDARKKAAWAQIGVTFPNPNARPHR